MMLKVIQGQVNGWFKYDNFGSNQCICKIFSPFESPAHSTCMYMMIKLSFTRVDNSRYGLISPNLNISVTYQLILVNDPSN